MDLKSTYSASEHLYTAQNAHMNAVLRSSRSTVYYDVVAVLGTGPLGKVAINYLNGLLTG